MKLIVNGVEQRSRAAAHPAAARPARGARGTSPKAGCQQGGCGSCTVLVDGEPRRACLMPLAAVEGASVTTLEGLGRPRRSRRSRPRSTSTTPRSAASARRVGPRGDRADRAQGGPVDRDEILEALGGHVCRCTGYAKILDAVAAASRGEGSVENVRRPRWSRRAARGARHEGGRRTTSAYDGLATSRARRSTSTTCAYRMLWVKALRSPHHRAHRHVRHDGPSRCPACARSSPPGRPEERLRPSRGARRPARRAAARRPRRPLEGSAIAVVAAPPRRPRSQRSRRSSDLRGAASRSSTSAALWDDPDVPKVVPGGQRLSPVRAVLRAPGPQGRRRPRVRAGGRDRAGRLPPGGDRARAHGDPGRASSCRTRAAA